MGAVVDGTTPIVFRNIEVIRSADISEDTFDEVMHRELLEIERRKHELGGLLPVVDIRGKVVILVDDGIATGSTMRAAVLAVQQAGVEKIVVAVPVASMPVIADLESEVEEVVCLERSASFRSVGDYYRHFPQLSDDVVMRCLTTVGGGA